MLLFALTRCSTKCDRANIEALFSVVRELTNHVCKHTRIWSKGIPRVIMGLEQAILTVEIEIEGQNVSRKEKSETIFQLVQGASPSEALRSSGHCLWSH